MKILSLFSGIGGFDLAFRNAGMKCDSVCEIDKNCQNILRRHFPEAKLFDDIHRIGKDTHERRSIDLICGGFPCQDLSVAGKRAGLAGERSGLWFEFARVIDELEPRWVVIENVPGLLSSNKGKDFAVIIQWLAERGYGVAWRILDAQYFGVPQRRRRVFVVGSLGSGRAAEVLFERESSTGDTPARGKEGQVSSTLFASGAGTSRPAGTASETGFLVGFNHKASAARSMPIEKNIMPSLETEHQGMAIAWQQNTRDEVRLIGGDGQIAGALAAQAGMKQQNYVLQSTVGALQARDGKGIGTTIDDKVVVAPTLEAEYFKKRYSNQQFFSQNGDGFPVDSAGVRRLTPTECERLQGFPDGWTAGQADTVRYRQLGNAVAVPVAEWIAKRIPQS